MNDYVVHLTPIKNTMIASARIATYISKILKIPILCQASEVEKVRDARNLIVVNGPPAFCHFRDELAELLRRSDNWVWVQNDYMIYPPSQLNKVARERGWVDNKGFVVPPVRWTTIPKYVRGDLDVHFNWNALTTLSKPLPWDRRNGFVYYGAFRENRKAKFKKYLPVRTTISAPARAQARFEELEGKNFYLTPPFENLYRELSLYRGTVFIQDDRSDKKFMSLPNRFYECLSAKVAQFISVESVRSFEEAGYDMNSKWIVRSYHDINMHNTHRFAHDQNTAWFDRAWKERKGLSKKLKRAYEKIL